MASQGRKKLTIKILNRTVDGGGRASDLDMLMELEKTQGIMPGTTICSLADGTAWATRTFINKYYDEFAARWGTFELLRVSPHGPQRWRGW